MLMHNENEPPRRDRKHVKNLLEKRLKELQRQEARLHDSPLKSFYVSQEAILEDVLRRAHGHQDDATLLSIIELSILESRCHQKLTTDRGLKSLYGIKVRVLRTARLFIRKYFHPKKWTRGERK